MFSVLSFNSTIFDLVYFVENMARSEGKIYIGNLPPDVKESDVEDIFYKFGKILAINLKTPPGQPPFAFVEFDDPRLAKSGSYKMLHSNFQFKII